MSTLMQPKIISRPTFIPPSGRALSILLCPSDCATLPVQSERLQNICSRGKKKQKTAEMSNTMKHSIHLVF